MLSIKADEHTVTVSYRDKIVAHHQRSWQRKAVIENPNHVKDLLKTRKKAQLTKQQQLFLSLGKTAETYLEGLAATKKNLGYAIQRLLELRQSYGTETLLSALEVATQYKGYDVSYVENILY